ncbi:MAG: hypothetical protein ABIH18_10170 [Candidatus Omnitrophota bacterium]
MIEINFLPAELQEKPSAAGMRPGAFIYAVPAVFIILMLMHVYLALVGISLGHKYNVLNNKWKGFESQRKQVEDEKKKYNLVSQDSLALQEFTKGTLNWSEKLNLLSLKLPSGVWFNAIELAGRNFVLKGAVISLEKQEVSLINKFLSNLKSDSDFSEGFAKLELGPVKRDNIGGYDIINFVLEGVLN